MASLLNFRRRPQRDLFEAIVGPHFESLYASARRLTRTAQDAEDLVQDSCIKAYLKLDELAAMEHPRAWLLRVLYHEFIDRQRAERRSATGNADGDAAEQPIEEAHLQPEAQVERMQQVERVLGAMALLDKQQCALLAMHDVDGLSIAELSELTGLPENTVKSQLFRTRARLGRLLQNSHVKRVKLRLVGGQGSQ